MSRPQTALAKRTFVKHIKDIKQLDSELAPILRDGANEAERIIRLSLSDGIGATVRRAQIKQSLGAIRQTQADMFGEITRTMQRNLDRATRTAAEGTLAIDSVLAQEIGDAALSDSFLFAARHSVENVRSRLINGIRLSPKVHRTEALARRFTERAINRGLLLNKSAAEIARDVRNLIRPDVKGGVSFAAKRLARTELNNAFHTTTVRTAAAQPWVEGMKWNLSSSHPKPDPCDEYAHHDDGLGEGVFKPSEVPSKPHPQCLCFVTIVTIDEDEFINSLVSGKFDRFLAQQGP